MRMRDWLDADDERQARGESRLVGYPFGFMDEGAKREVRRSILKAIGIPTSMFTVIFALARTGGWISHWKEMLSSP